jgi:hypothetical protein
MTLISSKSKQIVSTLWVAGLGLFGLSWHLSAAAAELSINTETPALSEMLEEGAVRVIVNYTPFTDFDSGNNLHYRVFYDGEAIATLDTQAGFPDGRSGVTVEDLDSDGVAEVRIIEFSGGHRCCLDTTVYGLGESGFSEVDTRLVDGGLTGGWVEDLNGDGYSEVIKSDEAFFYKFAPFAGSSAPPQILTYRAGAFTDTTREFAEVLREHIDRLERESFSGTEFAGAPNGILADYVASKAMLGEFEEAWNFMLENYDPQSDWELEIRDETGEIIGYYPDYPTALKAFLEERGYL